jgi:hypothetical protein
MKIDDYLGWYKLHVSGCFKAAGIRLLPAAPPLALLLAPWAVYAVRRYSRLVHLHP